MAKIENQLEKFQLLFDNAPAALVAVEQNGQITEWNKQAEFMLGWKKDQALGQSITQTIVAPSSRSLVEESIKNIFNVALIPNTSRCEFTALRKDNSEFLAELTLIPLQANGRLILFARLRDLAEIKKLSAQTNKASLFLNAIVENIPDMIFIKEAKELRFTRFNKAGEELLGFSRNDLIGKNDFDFFPAEEAEFFTSIDRNVLAHKRLIEIPEESIQTKYKGQRILHTKKVPIYDENGEPEFLLGISEDITDKKQAEETQKKLWQEQQARLEAEKALKLRDDFISIAAHELRTPLTALSLQIQMLNKFSGHIESSQTEKFTNMMNSSQQQLNRFEKLVEDMLDVSRAAAGTLIFEKTEVNLSDVVRLVTKSLEPRYLKANCPLTLHLDPSVVGLWDKVRIEQVVTNLLSNAIKYGAGKPIEVSTKTDGTKAIFSVRDNGIGIAPSDQERIFNRFERAVSVKQYGGLGLGLYITHQIVTALSGQIRVHSELEKGSTFTVELPLKIP